MYLNNISMPIQSSDFKCVLGSQPRKWLPKLFLRVFMKFLKIFRVWLATSKNCVIWRPLVEMTVFPSYNAITFFENHNILDLGI